MGILIHNGDHQRVVFYAASDPIWTEPTQGPPRADSPQLIRCQKPGSKKLSDRYLFWELYGKSGALHGDWKLVAEMFH